VLKRGLQFSESLALKLVSLLLALILWITILGLKREEIRLNVKLEPLLPPGMLIINKIPEHIQFTFTGPRIVLKNLEKKLQPIRPDLRRSRDTTLSFSISEDLLGDLGNGVRVASFYPPNVLIRLEELIERYVPVKPTFIGEVLNGKKVKEVRVTPAQVSVTGPRGLVQTLESVGTEVINLGEVESTMEKVVPVEVDTSQGFQLSREKIVRVRIITSKK
jgi:YbbR domain-containing protein